MWKLCKLSPLSICDNWNQFFPFSLCLVFQMTIRFFSEAFLLSVHCRCVPGLKHLKELFCLLPHRPSAFLSVPKLVTFLPLFCRCKSWQVSVRAVGHFNILTDFSRKNLFTFIFFCSRRQVPHHHHHHHHHNHHHHRQSVPFMLCGVHLSATALENIKPNVCGKLCVPAAAVLSLYLCLSTLGQISLFLFSFPFSIVSLSFQQPFPSSSSFFFFLFLFRFSLFLFTQTAETAGDAAAGEAWPTNQLTFSRQHSWWPVPWRFSRKNNLFFSFFLLILLLRFPLNLKCPFAAKFNYTLRGEHDTIKKTVDTNSGGADFFPAAAEAASLIIASEFLRRCGQSKKCKSFFSLCDKICCWLALKSFFIKSAHHHHHHKVHNHHHTELAKKQNREH